VIAMMDELLVPEVGTPTDVAELARFLLSADSRYITGQVIACDGGLLVHQPQVFNRPRGRGVTD
jgi:NAD(P)-dependent dehydrogenase (short-subunit alcohol dehydrogenase family)